MPERTPGNFPPLDEPTFQPDSTERPAIRLEIGQANSFLNPAKIDTQEQTSLESLTSVLLSHAIACEENTVPLEDKAFALNLLRDGVFRRPTSTGKASDRPLTTSFTEALLTAVHQGYGLVEGVALFPRPQHRPHHYHLTRHCWNLDADGRVIDPIMGSRCLIYLGSELDVATAFEMWLNLRTYNIEVFSHEPSWLSREKIPSSRGYGVTQQLTFLRSQSRWHAVIAMHEYRQFEQVRYVDDPDPYLTWPILKHSVKQVEGFMQKFAEAFRAYKTATDFIDGDGKVLDAVQLAKHFGYNWRGLSKAEVDDALRGKQRMLLMQAVRRNHGCGGKDCRTEEQRCSRFGIHLGRTMLSSEELFEVVWRHLEQLRELAWERSREGRQQRKKQDLEYDACYR